MKIAKTKKYAQIKNKDFPALLLLIKRARKVIPGAWGKVERIDADWGIDGLLDIHVALLQDAPTKGLRNLTPGRYHIYFTWRPYEEGRYGPRGWDVKDYEKGEWWLPFEPSDVYLKLRQPPWDVPNSRKWDGTTLFTKTS